MVDTLEEVLGRWRGAEVREDAVALDSLLGADFSGDGPHGMVLGKRDWLAGHGNCELGALEPTPALVRVNDHAAVAQYRGETTLCTVVAVRRAGAWSIVNVQIGQLADVLPQSLCDFAAMSQVIADMSMSLDGFIADTNDTINDLVPWMFSGNVAVETANPGIAFQTSEASAGVLRDALGTVGALVSGRRNFDLASGWGGSHPMGVPVFVVTHEPPADWALGDGMRFVTDGVESAVEQAKAEAGDKIVGVATPSITQQCLDAGLLDAIHINLVPVLLGSGVPFFANLKTAPVALEGPEVVEGAGVTHLTYRVAKGS
jgi:dihydrofolate reductase